MKDKILGWVVLAISVAILVWLLVIKGLLGVFLTAVGLLWFLGLFLQPNAHRLYRPRMKTTVDPDDMPRLRPRPIATHEGDWVLKILVWLCEPRRWRLDAEWSRALSAEMTTAIGQGGLGSDTRVVIPEGFEMNGASVPRPFWTFFSPTGILFLPAIVHDYAYAKGTLELRKADGTTETVRLNRRQADDLFFHQFVEVNGMPWLVWLPYLLIRGFGYFVYHPEVAPPESPAKPASPPEAAAASAPEDKPSTASPESNGDKDTNTGTTSPPPS